MVEDLDRATLRRVDDKRNTVASIPDSNAALRRAKKEAYYQVCKILLVSYPWIDSH